MSIDSPGRNRFGLADVLAFAVPVALVVGFLIVYLVAPATYLKYVLSFSGRETEVVEILTWTSALVAGLILIPLGVALWIATIRRAGTWLPGGAMLVLMAGLAAFFLGGEEVSWGQTWFHWKTPAEMRGLSRETNLHNGRLGRLVHHCGNVFLIGLFLVGPVLWRFRERLPFRIPHDWRPAVAEWPVFTTIGLAFLLRLPKLYFTNAYSPADITAMTRSATFYGQYLEEINEQKEMLVAIGLLIYALYRIRVVTRTRAALAHDASPNRSAVTSEV